MTVTASSAPSPVLPRLEDLALPRALGLNFLHPVYYQLHFITFWLFRAVVPNDTSDLGPPPPQVFSKAWLEQVAETKGLRSSLFYPRWTFEHSQAVLIFILD